ncbi:MAG TPA: class I SAM-dependent methyltransferase [Thermoanaerobaculia bacterium]|nr:class I SAM-dependent methyltransferase [Thermoanaerobaculia bacterium]
MSDAAENEELWRNFSLANELSPAQRHRWRLVVHELKGAPRRAVVVDMGCGSGALLERIGLVFTDARLVGIDMEPGALALARQRLPSAEFVQGDLDDDAGAGLRDRADIVVCSEVLEHLATPERALRLAHDILRPEGRLVVTVPSGTMNDFDRAIGHRKHYRLDELTDLIEGAGFRDVHASAWGFPFHTLFRIALSAAPGTTGQFRDDRIGVFQRAIFQLLNILFYLNVRSRTFGRQLVATAARP